MSRLPKQRAGSARVWNLRAGPRDGGFLRLRRAGTALGYALVVGLVGVAALGAVTRSGEGVQDIFCTVANSVDGATRGEMAAACLGTAGADGLFAYPDQGTLRVVAYHPCDFQIARVRVPGRWSVIGQLPPGLSLNAATGQLTGVVLTSGDYSFGVAFDPEDGDASQRVSRSFTLSVAPFAALEALLADPVTLDLNNPVSFQIPTATIAGVSFDYSSSNMPQGLSVNSAGVVAGQLQQPCPVCPGAFQVIIEHGEGGTITLDFTYDLSDYPPTANDDSGLTVNLGQSLSIAGSTLLANDVDPDDAPLPLSLTGATSNAQNVSVSWNGSGFTATPSAATEGSNPQTVSFQYEITDGLFTDVATVNLTVPDPVRSTCRDWRNAGYTSSGSYQIKLASGSTVDLYCDMSTDGGGWTYVMAVPNGTRMSMTGALSAHVLSSSGNSTPAKLSDADIRGLAQAGAGEFMMVRSGSTYIFRPRPLSAWGSYSSTGWTNQNKDAKRSNGSWVSSACNGHYNNRGFSSWDDSPYQQCAYPYSGSTSYMTQNHTTYNGSIGSAFRVFIR